MMFVSIVGHASFHTALPSGPSMMERSYFRRSGAADGFAATAPAASVVNCGPGLVEAQSILLPSRRMAAGQIDNPRSGSVADPVHDLCVRLARGLEDVKAV